MNDFQSIFFSCFGNEQVKCVGSEIEYGNSHDDIELIGEKDSRPGHPG